MLASLLLGAASNGGCPISPSPLWSAQLVFPEDLSPADPAIEDPPSFEAPPWAKATLPFCDPGGVYFQDASAFVTHLDFATQLLDPFLGLDEETFDAKTLYDTGREALPRTRTSKPPSQPR